MRFLIGLFLLGVMAACGNDQGVENTPAEVAASAYRTPGPKSLELITVVNNRTGGGGHSALLIKGSQTVIFDPAGSFRDPRIAERADVIYGVTPAWEQAYKSAHARNTFHVVSQVIPVSDAEIDRALELARRSGPVGSARCTIATSGILRQLVGLEATQSTYFPTKLMDQVETIPGVKTTRYYEDDAGDVMDAVQASQLVFD